MRDAISSCNPPVIPYIGMYLNDLSFIEEVSPNYVRDNLLNFSKMRMIAHILKTIRQMQSKSYKIRLNTKVASYLLDKSKYLEDNELYDYSLEIEPRS